VRGGSTTGTVASLMIIHGTIGLLAELTGIYLILRMNTQVIPESLRVSNYKLVMQTLIVLWTLIAVGGFAIYYYRYVQPPTPPAAALTPAMKLLQQTGDLSMHADEMQSALQRSNLATAKRHAEHVINLVEGKNGADYGDVDGDGTIQDPGDGVGLVNYLDQLLAISKPILSGEPETVTLANQVKTEILKVAADAKAASQASDPTAVSAQINEAAQLADQIANGPGPNMTELLLSLNLHPSQQPGAVPAAPAAGTQSVNVLLKDYVFSPKTLTVKVGTTVVFFNQDADKHTVTSDTGVFDSGDLDTGKSFSFTFTKAGTFPYYCVYHGDKGGVGMAGVITVTP
jgi:plastocyanin